MAFDADNEILQDFLIEAGEILEKLGEQLVELEHRPTDRELLNAIFRGFHTVKGGAGFLNITALVEVCHRAEDVFNILRQGDRIIDADLMDVVLRVIDVVNSMMKSIRTGVEPDPADPAMLEKLTNLAAPQRNSPADNKAETAHGDEQFDRQEASERIDSVAKDDVEEKFEALLAKAAGDAEKSLADSSESGKGNAELPSDEITEEEFEALLDKLHGEKSKSGSSPTAREVSQGTKPATSQGSDGDPSQVVIGMAGGDDQVGFSGSVKDVAGKQAIVTGAAAPAIDDGMVINAKDVAAQSQVETTVRVDTKRLDDIMNLVGELVLVRNRLDTLKLNMGNDDVAQAVSNLDVVTSDLQSAVMKTRMQPIKKVFGRFPRVVRDLSRSLKKEIELELVGEETDLDKNLVEALADPLVHLVRNSVDHGIESPEARQAAGKNRTGKITLSAKQEGDHILLTIGDDGAGMNADRLRNNAVEKGLLDVDSAARLDEHECYNLIFMPGFSTKAEISDISGRGVGMDVVKTRISQLNGHVEVDSKEGEGTEIKVKLPLTLAIVPTLMVVVGGQIFAIPLANVNEIIQYDSIQKSVVDGQAVAIVREHPLPLYFLRNWLVSSAAGKDVADENSYIVVIKIGVTHIACVVDHLISQEEVVIKPLGALLYGLPGLAGATITGDGRIAIILDMPSLISSCGGRIK
jgi:two-component system chemotaxis sensor kinase CheA